MHRHVARVVPGIVAWVSAAGGDLPWVGIRRGGRGRVDRRQGPAAEWPNLVDRLVGYLAPAAGLKRLRARAALERAKATGGRRPSRQGRPTGARRGARNGLVIYPMTRGLDGAVWRCPGRHGGIVPPA